jgi:hemerythrin
MSELTEIDQQHRELVNILNKLDDAVINHETRKNIYRIINEIVSYTETHFANEERLMVQTRYPEIESHKSMHKELTKDTFRLRDKLQYFGEDKFREWFNKWPLSRAIAHIQYADKKFEDYLIQHGVKDKGYIH